MVNVWFERSSSNGRLMGLKIQRDRLFDTELRYGYEKSTSI